jgi:large subunit ribosomal protein L32
VACPQCKSPKLPHTACSVCGTYNGRQVLEV